jgi:replication-associated recombination protein RarA
MSLNNLLLWEKWRPKNMDDVILLPRIRKYFENGVNGNYIFYGNYGTGKTSLARILIGKYTKNTPYLELNSSLYTSIDSLRGEIENFCKFTPMMESESDIKFIFLDEFERVSVQFQDAPSEDRSQLMLISHKNNLFCIENCFQSFNFMSLSGFIYDDSIEFLRPY